VGLIPANYAAYLVGVNGIAIYGWFISTRTPFSDENWRVFSAQFIHTRQLIYINYAFTNRKKENMLLFNPTVSSGKKLNDCFMSFT
jgi:hypothetical protein